MNWNLKKEFLYAKVIPVSHFKNNPNILELKRGFNQYFVKP